MPWPPLHRETLTVVRVIPTGTVDADGVAETTVKTRPWPGCNVQPTSTSEDTVRAERVTEWLAVSGDLATWLSAGDEVQRDGATYRVEGQPKHYRGTMPHTEAVLVTWTGA